MLTPIRKFVARIKSSIEYKRGFQIAIDRYFTNCATLVDVEAMAVNPERTLAERDGILEAVEYIKTYGNTHDY